MTLEQEPRNPTNCDEGPVEREHRSLPQLRASLVLTVLNEQGSIRSLFEGIQRQTLPLDEIVIVDGGSTDQTLNLVRRFEVDVAADVTVIVAPGANISKGRNIGVDAASNELILVTDGGANLDQNWARHLVESLSTGADVACGFFTPQSGDSFPAILGALTVPILDEIDSIKFLPSSRSVGFTKRAWATVGGYPEWLDYCEDLIFDIALKDAGFNFAFVPDAQVAWNARSTVRGYFKQYFRYGRGDGKACLWPRRHAIRYCSYGAGLFLVRSGSQGRLLLIMLTAAYLHKFWKRALTRRSSLGVGGTTRAVLLAVALVPIGDLAKMSGFPIGVCWRWNRKC